MLAVVLAAFAIIIVIQILRDIVSVRVHHLTLSSLSSVSRRHRRIEN